ncbi:nitroreductase family protein [Chloroflexota bacterium]
MDYSGLLELVKKRRSIRRFKPDPIPDEYIDKIIEVARWAPSGFNIQPWEFVVVKDKELQEKIATALVQVYDRVYEPLGTVYDVEHDFRIAPVYIIAFCDTRALGGLPTGAPPDVSGPRAQAMINSCMASAYLYLHLAATSLGLASHWVSSIMHPPLRDILASMGIPSEFQTYHMMAVGYPGYKPWEKVMRLKEEIVHYDYCCEGEFRTQEQIDEYSNRNREWNNETHRRGLDIEITGTIPVENADVVTKSS